MSEKNYSTNNKNKDNQSKKTALIRFWNGTIKNMSSIRQILIWYLVISLIGAFLLWAPISHNDGQSVDFIDALFVSSSAFSDTGLSTVGISETFNWFGQLVTLILLNIGGVGWFTIKIFILTFILRKTTKYNDIADGASELGTMKRDETLGLIFSAVILSITASLLFGFIFSFIFLFTGVDGIDNYGIALWTGIYHASTSVNNSGLDIFVGDNSISELYAGETKVGAEVSIEILTMMLFIVGGIGFGVFYDVYRWLTHRMTGAAFNFSLVTKISVVTYAVVALSGLGLTYLFEGLATIHYEPSTVDQATQSDPFLYQATGMDWWNLTFNTFSTRNAGFSALNSDEMSSLQDSTKLVYSVMMFIGSGPGSTAGGLRTTTVAVIFIFAWGSARGRSTYTAGKRTLPIEVIRTALLILIASTTLVAANIILLTISETISGNDSGASFIDNMFTVFSAYGTTGLSTTSIGDYNWFSKLLIIILMFIGQMGMSTSLMQLKSKKHVNYQKQFIEESVSLG